MHTTIVDVTQEHGYSVRILPIQVNEKWDKKKNEYGIEIETNQLYHHLLF